MAAARVRCPFARVVGAGFGASQSTSIVTFNGTAATPTAWSDTAITVPVPSGATSSNFTYDPSNRFRLATVFGFAVGYDNNGNMTSEPNITYAYGSRNLLDRATTPDATTDYTYDADSWRLKKETVNGAVTYYVRGADGQLLTEQATTAGGMTTTKNYVYAGGRLLAVSKFTAAQ